MNAKEDTEIMQQVREIGGKWLFKNQYIFAGGIWEGDERGGKCTESDREFWREQFDHLLSEVFTQDGRLAVVRKEAELPKNPLIWGQKGMEPRIVFDNAQQLMLDAGFVQEVMEVNR